MRSDSVKLHRRRLALTACVLALCAAAPGEAAAATRLVDDDGRQCAGAARTIQAAVTAAAPRDVISVCPGTYRENVSVPATKQGLQITGRTPHTAVVSPAANNKPVLNLFARDTVVSGLRIRGPYPSTTYCPAIHSADQAGVLVQPGGSARVAANRLEDLYQPGCEAIGIGVRVTFYSTCRQDTSATIEDNQITNFGFAGVVLYCGYGLVRRNAIRGNGTRSRDGIFLYYWARGHLTDNDVSGAFRGVRGESYYTGNSVERNSLHDNRRQGLFVEGEEGASWLISGNDVRRNRMGGLQVSGAGLTLTGNTSLGNGTDCIDGSAGEGGGTAGTANTWTGNTGVTQTPRGICTPPAP